MLPLIVRPALLELTGAHRLPEFQMWVGRLFYIPAFAGGIFGLLGGYLTDRLGRRRVLTWSILLYAVSAFASGFSTSIEMLLVLRCSSSSASASSSSPQWRGWPNCFPTPCSARRSSATRRRSRRSAACWSRPPTACASPMPHSLPALTGFASAPSGSARAWRYTLMSGVIPALPLIIIRPFLPESPVVAAEEGRRHAQAAEHRRAVRAGAAPHDDRHHDHVRLATAPRSARFSRCRRSFRAFPKCGRRSQGLPASARRALITGGRRRRHQGAGGRRPGRPLAAGVLPVAIVSRRKLLRLFQIPGLIMMPIVFALAATTSLDLALYVGDLPRRASSRSAQFSFWGNYLPRVYPVHLRGTGESFAANIGGRLIGTRSPGSPPRWQSPPIPPTRRPRSRWSPPPSASPCTWSASSPAYGCPSRQRKPPNEAGAALHDRGDRRVRTPRGDVGRWGRSGAGRSKDRPLRLAGPFQRASRQPRHCPLCRGQVSDRPDPGRPDAGRRPAGQAVQIRVLYRRRRAEVPRTSRLPRRRCAPGWPATCRAVRRSNRATSPAPTASRPFASRPSAG